MVGRHVNAAPGETYEPERLKPGGHHLLSRQRRGAVSTPERRRQETRERKALQGIGRSESAAFSERLDFRESKQRQARVTKPNPRRRNGDRARPGRCQPVPSPVGIKARRVT